MVSETKVDLEKIHWIETLDRLVNNLCIAPVSFRFCSPEDVADRFYTAECSVCGWWGSSKLLNGGGDMLTQETILIALAPCVGTLILMKRMMRAKLEANVRRLCVVAEYKT